MLQLCCITLCYVSAVYETLKWRCLVGCRLYKPGAEQRGLNGVLKCEVIILYARQVDYIRGIVL